MCKRHQIPALRLDVESGQHYFHARQYRNLWGRFTTVDPATSTAAYSIRRAGTRTGMPATIH